MKSQKLFVIFSLLVIIATAGFFRFWQLDSIPPGLYPDEAMNGNNAVSALQSKEFKVFYPENNGREGFFINLIAVSFSVFGISIWSLKLVSAVIGTMTVLGLYLLTKELLDNRRVALFSSFFLATSFWHINFSRISFRAIFVPFILTFGFYFLFKGFRTKKKINFILAGLLFGLGFNTYIAFRLAILPLGIVLILWLFCYLKEYKKFLSFTALFLLFAFLAALPLLIYFLNNPQDFIGRASGVSVFTQENPMKALSKSLIVHLGMFNIRGDHNWRHNISGSPVLFWPVGVLFLIGMAFSLKSFIISVKKNCLSFLLRDCLLLSWFFALLLPGILTYEGIPHSLRCIGAIPPVFIFAGIGAEFICRKIKRKSALIILSLILLFASFLYGQYYRYFITWAQNPEVKGAFAKNYVEIGNYLNSLPPEIQRYLIVNQDGVTVNNIPMPAQTVMFIEKTQPSQNKIIYLTPDNLNKIKPSNSVVIPLSYDQDLFRALQIKFPEGKIKKEKEIWIYSIK